MAALLCIPCLNWERHVNRLLLLTINLAVLPIAGDLAKCILTIISQGVNEPKLYHFCGDKIVSWYEFAAEIFSLAKLFDDSYRFMVLSSINSEQYKCAAKRPKHAILNCEKIYRERGICNSNWRMSLDKVVPKIIYQMNN
ncbi:TPA: sugar nucleotide-binding protein [Serratia marcescens]